MTEFDSPVVRQFMNDLQTELTAIEKKLGVKLTVGRASYSKTICTVKVEAAITTASGEAETKMGSDFKRYASRWGLKPTDLHRTFKEGGKTWKIVGGLPRGSATPIVCQNDNGTQYKLPADRVRRGLAEAGGTDDKPKTGKRADKEILEDLRDVECQLSPENLTCDGEAKASYVKQRSRELTLQRKELVEELGREPTTQELYPELRRK